MIHKWNLKNPEMVWHTTSSKNPEDIMLNGIKLQKCRYYVTPTYIRYLDHIKRWKALEMDGGGADSKWIYLTQ